MNISQLKQSNFLTRGDVGQGILVTIKAIFQENVAKSGAPEELKWCIEFLETEKPMVLNNTNGQIIARITNSPETDDWPGHKIVLYDDPNVSFAGKITGGIRVRAPRVRPQPAAAATAVRPAAPTPRPARPAPAPEPPAELPPESDYSAEEDTPF